jgi:hypothetical protein
MGLHLNKHGRDDLCEMFVRILTVPERQKVQLEVMNAENGAMETNVTYTI